MAESIGDFARQTGLSVHTLRYYEQEGLLTPARDGGGRRRYTPEDAAWVDFLKRLKATGMPIREMRRYAALRAQGGATLEARLALLEAHAARLDADIRALLAHREKLQEKIAFYREKTGEGI